MVSKAHELPLDMIRRQPQLAPELLRIVFGIPIPKDEMVALGSESFPETDPAEYRCDATVMIGEPKRPKLGIVVESQLRFNEEKLFTWPAYLAALRSRRRCDVVLLVLCPDGDVAQACATPITMGHPGWMLRPLTLSPQDLPPVLDPVKARDLPELAILGAPVHADGRDAVAVLTTYAEALESLPTDVAAKYRDHAESLFSDAARKLLEEIVKVGTYEYTSQTARHYVAEGRAEGKAEGKVEGEARAVLLVLDGRGVEVSDEQRERITSCTDTAQLEEWLRRAGTVGVAEQLFG